MLELTSYIFGPKTFALFDIWSIEHVLSGLSIGTLVLTHNKKHFHSLFKFYNHEISEASQKHRSLIIRFDIFLVLFAAFLWESIEHYLETGLLGSHVEYWFQGVEMWGNRLVTDPLLLILGYFIVRKYPRLAWPARGLSFAWLFIHIFMFPHSMYLQQILFG